MPSFEDTEAGYFVWIGPVSNCSLYKIKKVKYGGMSKILFLEHDNYIKNHLTGLPKKLVLKGIKKISLNEEHTRKILQEELINWADIDHQNVTKCLGIGGSPESLHSEDRGEIFALIQQNDGDLRYLIKKLKNVGSCFGINESLRACAIILQALDDVYKNKGLLHQDLKPGNILFKKNKTNSKPFNNLEINLSITDWGISKIQKIEIEKSKNKKELEQTILGNGTPLYMAPERFFKKCKPNVSQDIFAIGLILFELFDGNHLFNYRNLLYRNYNNNHWLYSKNLSEAAFKYMSRADYVQTLICYEHDIIQKGYTDLYGVDFNTRQILNLIRLFIEPDEKKRINSFEEALRQIEVITSRTKTIVFKRKRYELVKQAVNFENNLNGDKEPEIDIIYEDLENSLNNNSSLTLNETNRCIPEIIRNLQKKYIFLVEKAFLKYDSLSKIKSAEAKKLLKRELSKIYENIYKYGRGDVSFSESKLFAQDLIPFALKARADYLNKYNKDLLFEYLSYLFMAFKCGTISLNEKNRLKLLEMDQYLCITCKDYSKQHGDEIQWVCCLKGGPDGSYGEIILIEFSESDDKNINEDNLLDIFPKPTLYYVGIEMNHEDIDDNCKEYCSFLNSRYEDHNLKWLPSDENDSYRISEIKTIGSVPNLPNDEDSIYNFFYQWDINIFGYHP